MASPRFGVEGQRHWARPSAFCCLRQWLHPVSVQLGIACGQTPSSLAGSWLDSLQFLLLFEHKTLPLQA